MYLLYTDGACKGNPGNGGAGYIIIYNNVIVKEGSFRSTHTTNNRMELGAIIEGLSFIPPGNLVTVISDSQYVINTITKGWKRKKNTDLWPLLDKILENLSVNFTWVKGHSGNLGNERCDSLASYAATAFEIKELDKYNI